MSEYLRAFAGFLRLTAMTLFSGFSNFYGRERSRRNFSRVSAAAAIDSTRARQLSSQSASACQLLNCQTFAHWRNCMPNPIRHWSLLAACAFAVNAYAQSHPAKPVRIIVPFEPGGPRALLPFAA